MQQQRQGGPAGAALELGQGLQEPPRLGGGAQAQPAPPENSDSRTTALSSRGMLPWPVAPVAEARSQAMPFSATWIG